MITAIVYTSNTGYTAQYAQMLAKKIGLPAYPLEEAQKNLSATTQILYLGWLMAGSIKGYRKAAKRYEICAVCGVGMGATGSQINEVRKANALPADLPAFTLQGGFDLSRLHGIYKMMMNVMIKTAGKKLSEKQDRTTEEDCMLQMMLHGGSCVKEEHIQSVLQWYSGLNA